MGELVALAFSWTYDIAMTSSILTNGITNTLLASKLIIVLIRMCVHISLMFTDFELAPADYWVCSVFDTLMSIALLWYQGGELNVCLRYLMVMQIASWNVLWFVLFDATPNSLTKQKK